MRMFDDIKLRMVRLHKSTLSMLGEGFSQTNLWDKFLYKKLSNQALQIVI